MEAYRVWVQDYANESFAYVLADSPEAAIKSVRGEFDEGYGEIVAAREPKLDGDEITDRTLWESGLGYGTCTRCDRSTEGFDGFCDENANTCDEPTWDEWGRMFCSETCRDQMPQFPKPGRQLYAMFGTEF